MKWSEISIHTTQEAVEPISHILHEAGAGGVVIEDPADLFKERDTKFGEIFQLSADDYPEDGVILKAYLQMNSFLSETVDNIKQAVTQLEFYDIDIGRNEVILNEVHEEEWATAWKKYYKPVKVGERITISPSWENYNRVTENEIVVQLDPGMAFGTGTHPTTVLCIQALERYIKGKESVLDVGTGSGVLAIASAKLGASSIEAIDLDEVAVEAALDNVKINEVESSVNVTQGNLLDHITGTYDVLAANILAEVIVEMSEDAYKALKPGGVIITSGIIEKKRNLVKESLTQAGFQIIEVVEMEGWVAIAAEKKAEEQK
ncbi:50S ribosomal protein L11 methyltransferase [Alkalicoccus daliensis]|uniref:Ribosomal protein L11 methyltransferase n=1 Tax=Alkalicoccus daliensis TaxID=745820 RepID=A0A1H0BDT4_9BACI|nr:50S ribosomal protein L11 methyltransferase [Alkalicoccus daliensis]SDN43787.1 ribosomal protein L11 methyltransferase [Alkalicoccus daliensis]